MDGEKNPDPNTSQPAANAPQPEPIRTENKAILRENKEKPPEERTNITVNMPPDTTRPVEWVQAGINGVLALIGIAAICIYGAQLTEMRKTNLLNRQQTIAVFAAVVGPSHPSPQPIPTDLDYLRYQGIEIGFPNDGKAAATNFHAEATLKREALPGYEVIGNPEHSQIDPVRIEAVQPSGVNNTPFFKFDTQRFTQDDIRSFNDLKEVMELSGSFSYYDGFGQKISNTFCFLYAVVPGHAFANGAAFGTGGAWMPCEGAKRVIEQALGWEKQEPNKQKPN